MPKPVSSFAETLRFFIIVNPFDYLLLSYRVFLKDPEGFG